MSFKWTSGVRYPVTVTVHLVIDADAFELGRVTRGAPGVHLELERVVPTTEGAMPFFWASGTDIEAFERSVREDESVASLTRLTRAGDRVLYQVEWGDATATLTEVLAAGGATVLEASGNESWSLRVRFPDHERLSAFHDACRARGVDFRVERIYALDDEDSAGDDFDLTAEQTEALVAAVERGYFEVPRGVTLSEVAAELGISQQAASERVRRGADAILRRVLLSRSGGEG